MLGIKTCSIVTGYGAASLKGRSSSRRIHVLIDSAHPGFRDGLLATVKEMHHV